MRKNLNDGRQVNKRSISLSDIITFLFQISRRLQETVNINGSGKFRN